MEPKNTKINTPNFTQIPNCIFDYWITRMKPTSFCILSILCRKIFGWHKTTDSISANQLCKATSFSKTTVLSSLKELEDLGLIFKTQSQDEFGSLPNEYSLNITIPEDNLYSDETLEKLKKRSITRKILPGGSTNSVLGVVQILDQGVVQNLYPQKKDITKERLNKESVGERKKNTHPLFSSSEISSFETDEISYPKIQANSSSFSSPTQHNLHYHDHQTHKSLNVNAQDDIGPPNLTLIKRRFNVSTTESQHQELLSKYGDRLEKAYDLLSSRKIGKEVKYADRTDYGHLHQTWVLPALDKIELENQDINSKKQKLIKLKTCSSEEIEENKESIRNYIQANRYRLDKKSVYVSDKAVKIGNDEIQYNDPKFNELATHSLRKAGLI